MLFVQKEIIINKGNDEMARVYVHVSKKTLKIVIAICAVFLAALLAGIIVHIVNYSSYETVDAKVINVYSQE